jgi:hypothetical protein
VEQHVPVVQLSARQPAWPLPPVVGHLGRERAHQSSVPRLSGASAASEVRDPLTQLRSSGRITEPPLRKPRVQGCHVLNDGRQPVLGREVKDRAELSSGILDGPQHQMSYRSSDLKMCPGPERLGTFDPIAGGGVGFT